MESNGKAVSPKKKKVRRAHFKLFGKSYGVNDTVVGVSFFLPALILGSIFVIAPMLISLGYAFTDAKLLSLNNVHWAGFRQFALLFKDKIMWKAFGNSMEFVVKVVPLQLCASLGLALILNTKIRGNTFFRWAFFVPVMLSLAVTSMLWMNLFNEQDGLINSIFEFFGLQRQKFLKDPDQALDIIVFISAWQGAGYQMLIFLSALKNIPRDIYEAADLDGANKLQVFWHITLPSIKETFSFVLVTMLIGAFRLITQPMIMTQGGPINSTITMSYYIYKQGVDFRDVGYSSAIAFFYTIVMATVALTIRRLFGKDNTL
ncbi:MAG: sugar ABC transporter permease [Clostridia bacterium]|nr:sugar ABC transporter permease [Clostridia bacterium]